MATSHFMMELKVVLWMSQDSKSRKDRKKGWKRAWATEPLIANGDNLSVRQLIAVLQGGTGGRSGHLLQVQGDAAQLLLDVTHAVLLSGGGEVVAAFCEYLHEVVCQVPASQVQR